MRVWAIKIHYLESKYTGDGKWHWHTTKWYNSAGDAWQEKERFLNNHKNIDECGSSVVHKEK